MNYDYPEETPKDVSDLEPGLLVPEEYDLYNASDTDEIYMQAFQLAAWALRQGMESWLVVDWVLDQPREDALPRGSSGKLNPTEHHVHSGAEYAVDTFDPVAARPDYDPAPVEALRKRIKLAGLKQEPYLLGALALCDRYETYTPVITGKNLSEASGKGKRGSDDVLSGWARTYAHGLFTRVTYDGQRGHGRVWTVNLEWEPVAPLTHEPGCRRGTRCTCRKSAQNTVPIFSAAKIDTVKCAPFEEFLESLPSGSKVTITDVCKATGLTRYMAGKHLREAEGGPLLSEGTAPAGFRRINGRRTRQGETWFTPGKPARQTRKAPAPKKPVAKAQYPTPWD